MSVTLTIIKADVRGYVAYSNPNHETISKVRGCLESAKKKGLLLDFYATRCRDGSQLSITHEGEKEKEETHKLVWDTSAENINETKKLKLHKTGHVLFAEAFSGINERRPSTADMQFEEREAEKLFTLGGRPFRARLLEEHIWIVLFLDVDGPTVQEGWIDENSLGKLISVCQARDILVIPITGRRMKEMLLWRSISTIPIIVTCMGNRIDLHNIPIRLGHGLSGKYEFLKTIHPEWEVQCCMADDYGLPMMIELTINGNVPEDELRKVIERAPGVPCCVHRSTGTYHVGVYDKKNAAKFLCELLPVLPSQTIGVGDTELDEGMLSIMGLAIATEESPERVKDCAHLVLRGPRERYLAHLVDFLENLPLRKP